MEETEKEIETVKVPMDQLVTILRAAEQIRTMFLVCAPRFSAGSRGEHIVAIAAELGKTLEAFYSQLTAKPEKADRPDPATAK